MTESKQALAADVWRRVFSFFMSTRHPRDLVLKRLGLTPNDARAFTSLDRTIPEDFLKMFQPTSDPLDGIAQLSAEWILKNMPELKNVKFTMYRPGCMSNAIVVGAQAVGEGLTNTCLVLKGWHNFQGRYYQGGANAQPTISGRAKWTNIWAGPTSYTTAMEFERYCRKYGKSHDMMAPFVSNSRRNGLMFPEGYWAQHRPEPITREDYLNARWVAKPASLFDNDLPIMACVAYLFTTPERAKDMKQKPVYILNHASDRIKVRSIIPSLEEAEECAASNGRKLLQGAGLTAGDLSSENMYDGFSLFHVFHLEGLGFAGVKKGEALDFFQTDITIEGPTPSSPSGGNIGSGRSRFWMHTDCIQQIQGRAGKRQIKKAAEVGVSVDPFSYGGNFAVWGASPN